MTDNETYVECLLTLSTPHAKAHQLVWCAIKALALIPLEGRRESEWMQDVHGVFLAVPVSQRSHLFWLLDNGATTYGADCDVNGERVEWHWRLRRTRNDTMMGAALFSVLQGAA